MAKIAEQLGVVKVSKLVKDTASSDLNLLSDDDIQDSLVAVLEELLGDGVVVEFEVADE